MNNKYTVRTINSEDKLAVMDIFNYYIENSFAAYPEQRLPNEFFEMILASCKGYPTTVLLNEKNEVKGFGFLRAYNPMPAFKKTAEISYFISPDETGKGLGNLLLDHLVEAAKKQAITCILASISSLNVPSLKFHQKHGFAPCGKFTAIGIKKGVSFDVIWMQKQLG